MRRAERQVAAQLQLVTQQDQLAATRGNIVLSLIQVYRALGGGWQAFLQGNGMPELYEVSQPPQNAPPTSE